MERARLKQHLKKEMIGFLARCRVDDFFRYLNKDKLLVVMYHGVTCREYSPPVWTQLPVSVFRRQLDFLRKHYQIVTLAQVVAALRGERALPERAVLITFDDGMKNNYTVAFPILKELHIPASIFLTVDFIGKKELLWFDELYLLIQEGWRRGVPLPLPGGEAAEYYRKGNLWEAYVDCVESAKRIGDVSRAEFLGWLRGKVPIDSEPWLEDFGLLDWDEVIAMERSGLVSFGVHTATHRILSELEDNELAEEVLAPREVITLRTGSDAASFCFPNGRPGVDFYPWHQEFLRNSGYRCAFTTENALFDWRTGEPMGIGRVPAGSDGGSEPSYFSLNTSGALDFVRRVFGT